MNSLPFSKYISIIHRNTNRYFNHALAPFQIGCGQQFFLARIAEQEGRSLYDLAELGHFDKGTVTRAVQKLEDLGYIHGEADEHDRRIRRLYLTEAATPVLTHLREQARRWDAVLSNGLSATEIDQAKTLLERLAHNACQHLTAPSPSGENAF